MNDPSDTFDAVVVGAGPGGIAAAVVLGESGRRVVLVDDNPNAGGQIWRNRGIATAPPAARVWLERVAKCGNIHHLPQTQVAALFEKGALLVESAKGARLLKHRSLILATGARERFVPFPGWTLPGVFGAGATQALIKSGMSVKGMTAVVAGTGPLLLAVADLLRVKGAAVPLMIEQADASSVYLFGAGLALEPSKLLQGLQLRLRSWRTRYVTSSNVLKVRNVGQRLLLTYSNRGRERQIECDLVASGFDLMPNNEAARALGCLLTDEGFVVVDANCQTSVPDTYAVGEITGIGGVEKALIEGQLAGNHIVGRAAGGLARSRDRARRFVKRLNRAFALDARIHSITTSDCIVCRCEDVTLGQIQSCRSARDAKLQTRCGMGPCQGRVCGSTVERVFGDHPHRPRPLIASSSVGALAKAAERRPTD